MRPAWTEDGLTQTRVAPFGGQPVSVAFGVGETTDYTLEEVGQRFAVTRERIRQIEAKALRKLRRPQRTRPLGTPVQRGEPEGP